ncbi:MAG: glycerophosphodiester phosphodiesterase family protein [Wenzhouxiangella sp.]
MSENRSGPNGQEAINWLVAHRGWPDRYPENSLDGIQAALAAGARFVEVDVQISADGQPVVIHDDDLSRLTSRWLHVTQLPLRDLQKVEISGPGGSSAGIPTLDDLWTVMSDYPQVTAFVELKRQSIRRHGLHTAVEIVQQALARAPCRVVLISFHRGAVQRARETGSLPVGWVFKPWSPLARWLAGRLQPDYLFVRADRVPRRAKPFWNGPWQWVIYGVDTLEQARALKARGADLIEVDDLPGLISTESG